MMICAATRFISSGAYFRPGALRFIRRAQVNLGLRIGGRRPKQRVQSTASWALKHVTHQPLARDFDFGKARRALQAIHRSNSHRWTSTGGRCRPPPGNDSRKSSKSPVRYLQREPTLNQLGPVPEYLQRLTVPRLTSKNRATNCSSLSGVNESTRLSVE